MPDKYQVKLSAQEQQELNDITHKGKHSARTIKRAHILLLSNENPHDTEESIAARIGVSVSTVYRTRLNLVEYGMEEALFESARSGRPKKMDATAEALLIATACTKPPAGRSRWTLFLLGQQLVGLTELQSISLETIRQRLNDNDLKPWQKKMWCIGKMDAEYVARMENILDLYAQPADEKNPIVNFDETGKQCIQEVNPPTLAKPGVAARQDYEYARNGVANIFMMFDRHRGWRSAKVTDRKESIDFAHCMKELVDEYPGADKIRVVMDNLSTHTEASLYKAFPAAQARGLLQKLEFHFTPKHASWLNMAEIEIGVMQRQCLDRRIPDRLTLKEELKHWQEERNAQYASINWMFDLEKARTKFDKAYQMVLKKT